MFTGLLGIVVVVFCVAYSSGSERVDRVGTESGHNSFVPLLTSAGNRSSLG